MYEKTQPSAQNVRAGKGVLAHALRMHRPWVVKITVGADVPHTIRPESFLLVFLLPRR